VKRRGGGRRIIARFICQPDRRRGGVHYNPGRDREIATTGGKFEKGDNDEGGVQTESATVRKETLDICSNTKV